MDRRLQWLGHLRRMKDERMPKQLLFGELRKKRACHGTKKRWQDHLAGDLQAIGLKDGWYQLCQSREAWFANCRDGVNEVASSTVGSTTLVLQTGNCRTVILTVSVDERSDDKET